MPIIPITIVLASFILLIASYFDLKEREIPDKVSLALIVTPALISGAYSVFRSDYSFIIASISLGIAYFILGYIPFRLGQWGGGDLKLLSGIGCTIGFLASTGYFEENVIPPYMFYLINIGIVAFPYTIAYASIVSFKKKGVFSEFRNYFRSRNSVILFVFSFIPFFIAFLLKTKILIAVYSLLPLFILASFYLKAFEKIALRETVNTGKLREGDVLAEDLMVGCEKIASKRDIEGLTHDQIKKIRELLSEKRIPESITIKKGVEFVPVFFIAFLLTVYVGDMLGAIFNLLL